MKVFTSDSELAEAVPNAVHEVVVKNRVLYIAVGLTPGAWEPLEVPASGASASGPQWVKYSVSFNAIALGELDTEASTYFRVPLFTTVPGTVVHDAVMKPTESFGPDASGIAVSVGVSIPGVGCFPTQMINAPAGFGDGPGIESDPSYVVYAEVASNYTAMSVFPGSPHAPAMAGATSVYLFLGSVGDSSLEAYQALTSGGVDVWLLQSVLP